MRKLFLVLCVMLLPTAADAASSIATSWPTNAYALTDGATITVPCPGSVDASGVGASGFYTLTVLGNNHAISLPSCSIPSAFLFRIVQGAGGPYTGLTFTAGSNTVNSPPVGVYSQTQTAGAIDDVGGQIVSSGVWDFFAPQYALVPPPAFSIAHSVATACASGTSCVAGSITYDNTSQVGYVAIGYCDTGGSSCAGGTTQGVTVSSVTQTSGGATSTCTAVTGIAGVTDATNHLTQNAFKCIATVAGTAIYTIAFTGPGSGLVHLPEALVATINGVTTTSPDDGIGKSAANTPSAAAPAVTTTATTNQASEFLISAAFAVGGSGAPTVGSGYASIVSDNTGVSSLLQWKTSGASGSTQSASAVATSATGSIISVAGLKHP